MGKLDHEGQKGANLIVIGSALTHTDPDSRMRRSEAAMWREGGREENGDWSLQSMPADLTPPTLASFTSTSSPLSVTC
eukprot:61688-Rhodomonas_salina.1